MWIGVIVMIATMTSWVRIKIPAPLATAGDQPRPGGLFFGGPILGEPIVSWVAAAAILRASWSGSGRSITHSTRPAAPYATPASRNGPAKGGIPRFSASVPMRPTRLGPTTAPTVVATSTVLTARPLLDGAARSAPA